jgi:hypothetical protein
VAAVHRHRIKIHPLKKSAPGEDAKHDFGQDLWLEAKEGVNAVFGKSCQVIKLQNVNGQDFQLTLSEHLIVRRAVSAAAP